MLYEGPRFQIRKADAHTGNLIGFLNHMQSIWKSLTASRAELLLKSFCGVENLLKSVPVPSYCMDIV